MTAGRGVTWQDASLTASGSANRERRIPMMGTDDSTRGIAAERWEELREFRATHPPKHISVAGVGWDYLATGAGEEALLLLPGGAMVAEAGFTRIPAFEDRYRVIAPDYPPVSTAAQLLDGLASWTRRGCGPRTCSDLPTEGSWRSASCAAIPSEYGR